MKEQQQQSTNPFRVGSRIPWRMQRVIREKDAWGTDSCWYCDRRARVPNNAEAEALYRKYVSPDPRYDLWDFLDGNGFTSPLDDDLNSVIHLALRAADDDSLRLAGLVRVEKEKP